MKKTFFLFVSLLVAFLCVSSCLRINVSNENTYALCFQLKPYANWSIDPTTDTKHFSITFNYAPDTSEPKAQLILDDGIPPILQCYTDGTGEKAVYNPAYNPDIKDKKDIRHYEFLLIIPQEDENIMYVFNWPDTYR